MGLPPFLFPIYVFLSSLLAIIASASDSGYGNRPDPGSRGELLSTMIGVQGLIYCKSAPKLAPLEGAVARITCETEDEYGYEAAPFTILSKATDKKGYFLATLSPSEVETKLKLKDCRAYLELSPLPTCNFPTEINKGISGALLDSFRLLDDQKMKLFTVGPFVFAPGETQDKSIPNNY